MTTGLPVGLCCITVFNICELQNPGQLQILCVHDSVIIQKNKEHSLCKFTELLKKTLDGEMTYSRSGHVADGVGKLVIKQFIHEAWSCRCRTATFLLVLQ